MVIDGSGLAGAAPAQDQMVQQLLFWWDENQSDLPWRRSKDPYAIWVSEVMLQQTQIASVIPYYERWMHRFPDIESLAVAPLEDVLNLWQGLGYYSRARNLHAAAAVLVEQYNGRLPRDQAALLRLPGIGRYTAGAIASIAFNQPAPVVDGNIVRVLSRLEDLDQDVTKTGTRNYLWRLASALVPADRPGDFNQALMELGQKICLPAAPRCNDCPLAGNCRANQKGTQYERPVRPPRKRTPHFDVVAGVIWRKEKSAGNEFLIARRPLDGMLGGLWEFPGGKIEPGESRGAALQREIREELAIEITAAETIGAVKHAYTHFRITMHVLHAYHLNGLPQHLGVSDHAWVRLPDLDGYAFAVTDLKIIDMLKKELT